MCVRAPHGWQQRRPGRAIRPGQAFYAFAKRLPPPVCCCLHATPKSINLVPLFLRPRLPHSLCVCIVCVCVFVSVCATQERDCRNPNSLLFDFSISIWLDEWFFRFTICTTWSNVCHCAAFACSRVWGWFVLCSSSVVFAHCFADAKSTRQIRSMFYILLSGISSVSSLSTHTRIYYSNGMQTFPDSCMHLRDRMREQLCAHKNQKWRDISAVRRWHITDQHWLSRILLLIVILPPHTCSSSGRSPNSLLSLYAAHTKRLPGHVMDGAFTCGTYTQWNCDGATRCGRSFRTHTNTCLHVCVHFEL